MDLAATATEEPDRQSHAEKLLSDGAEAELRLLRLERKAEKRLAEARAALAADEERLHRAERRLERSREVVADAEATLREVQAQRTAGPAIDQG